MADVVKLTPTRLAALQQVAEGAWASSSLVTVYRGRGTGRLEHLTPAPHRWLVAQGLVAPRVGVRLVLTPAGQAALDAHP